MADIKFMPKTKLGLWGFWLIIAAMILVVLSMLTALFLRDSENQTAYNVLGVLVPVFIPVTLVALVVSWIAIIRGRDRGIFLIIFTSVLSVITVFIAAGEIVEGIMMSGK